MAANVAAGLLMCRWSNEELEYFLVHPGGPFFKNKDLGVWSIPKGLPEKDEDLLTTAQREFNEETGLTAAPPYYPLEVIKQKGGKIVHAWAFEGEWDPASGITCNSFKVEWPPKSGKFLEFPEQDSAAWMNYEQASKHINPGQLPFLKQAKEVLVAKRTIS
jgi:predicted NUDIX family NTP pyrophosphohydrolase